MPVLDISPLDVAQYELSQRLEVIIACFLASLSDHQDLEVVPPPHELQRWLVANSLEVATAEAAYRASLVKFYCIFFVL